MIKFLNRFRKIIIILSISLFSIILYSSLLKTDSSKYLNKVFTNSYIIYWLGTILLIGIMIIIHRVIKQIDIKKIKYVILIESIALIIGQIFIIKAFYPVQVTDSYLINDQAQSIALNIDKQVDYTYSSYFKRYSNNNFCLLITISLFKLFKFINIDYSLGLTIFNTIMIDLAILFCYLIFRKIKDKRCATEILAFNVLNPLNYLMIHWTYTCTYSIAFMVLIVYLAILLNYSKTKVFSKVIYAILFGLCLTLGYLLRPTIVIPVVAIIIYFFIFIIQKKIKIKEFILPMVLIVLIASLSFVGINNKIKEYIPDSSNTFPITHWIMMGLHGKGTVNSADNRFTERYNTKEEKRDANIKEIRKTLAEYKFSGLVSHLLVKLPVTWDNGSADYYLRIYQDQNQNSMYQYLIDGKNDFILIYCQSFRIMTIILVILSFINQLKKEKFDFLFFNTLLIFGAVIFYLIWEAKSAYSIPFLPFLFIIALDGIEVLDCSCIRKLSYKKLKMLFIIIFTTTIIFSISLFKPFARDRFAFNYYSVNVTNTGSSNFINNVNKDNVVIKQEFYSKRKFNKILLYANKNPKHNSSDIKYQVLLKNENDEVLNDFIIDSDDVLKNYITLKVDIDKVKADEKYLIEIRKKDNNKTDGDSINFGYIYSKVINTYSGTMYLNDEATTDKLFIKVYDKKKTTYMGKITYIVISIIVISIEIITYLYLKKEIKTINKKEKNSDILKG